MISPLSTDELRALYERIAEDTRKKQFHAEKMKEMQASKPKKGHSKGNSVSQNQSSDSDRSIHSHEGKKEHKKYNQIRSDLVKIADKLKVVEDLETLN